MNKKIISTVLGMFLFCGMISYSAPSTTCKNIKKYFYKFLGCCLGMVPNEELNEKFPNKNYRTENSIRVNEWFNEVRPPRTDE